MSVSRILGIMGLGLLTACGTADRPIPTPSLAGVEVTQSGMAKQLFGNKATPAALPSAPYGFYSKGCLAGAQQLPETGPTWQAMRLSRNRNWALPETLDVIQRISRAGAAHPASNGIYVGDLSQPSGGPMLTGHASHQVGLDADIWLVPATLGLSRQQRENISAKSYRRNEGAYTTSDWSSFQETIVKAAATDPRVERIFIFPGAKVAMCENATGDRSWLRKVRPYYGHHYHFHVRLSCPDNAPGCVSQDPPPPGDGCEEARQWVRNIINPPPPQPRDPNAPAPTPKRELTMSDLPQACQAVLAR